MIAGRFTQNYRDTSMNAATRTRQNEAARKERLLKEKQEKRVLEDQKIMALNQNFHSFDTKQSKAWHQQQQSKDQVALGQENGAATQLQALQRGNKARTNYASIIQTIKNEEQVRERQLKAAAADINRHRAAAASAAAFQKRGPGPISTMQMTTGRNGSSPPRQTRPKRPGNKKQRQRQRQIGAAYGNATTSSRPGRKNVRRYQMKKHGVPTPKRVRLTTEQRKRATRASRRGAATQWALQRKKAAQHALFVRIRNEMLEAGHDEEVVTNNALIAAKKLVVKRERAQLEKEAEQLRIFEVAENKRNNMIKRTKAAAAKKWQERQHRMTPVACTNLWRPSAGLSDDEDGASFLLGPVPKKQLPTRKSDKIRRSPVRVRPSTTGRGRQSRTERSNTFTSVSQPVRPSTSGGGRNNGGRRGSSRPHGRSANSIVRVQNNNANNDFPSVPETSSATSIFENDMNGLRGGSESDLEKEQGNAVGGRRREEREKKEEREEQKQQKEQKEKEVENNRKESDEYGDDDFYEDEFEDDEFEDDEFETEGDDEEEKTVKERKTEKSTENMERNTVEKNIGQAKNTRQVKPPEQTEQERTKTQKALVQQTYHSSKPNQKDPPPPVAETDAEWKCKCGFENDVLDQTCILCGVTQSECTASGETAAATAVDTTSSDAVETPLNAIAASTSKEKLKNNLKQQLMREMQREDSLANTSNQKKEAQHKETKDVITTKRNHSYPSLDGGSDDDDEDDISADSFADDEFEF
jgi:hypothetical protein